MPPERGSFPGGGPVDSSPGPGSGVALRYGPARLERELAGIERLEGHPFRPTVRFATDDRLGVAPYWDEPDPITALSAIAPETYLERTESRRAFLEMLSADVKLPRALGRLGFRRKQVDRWLAEEVFVRTPIGLGLGGVHPGFLKRTETGTVCLRCERARQQAWWSHDLAAFVLGDFDEDELRAVHHRLVGVTERANAAFELALAAVWIREAIVAPGPAGQPHNELEALLAAVPEPTEARVFIEGPELISPELFGHLNGDTVPTHRARWLLRALDGLSVGGGTIRVRTEPTIRRGKKPPRREPRTVRRRRLFSRWVDELDETEGLDLVDVTPEALAMRMAEGARGVVLDGTCGVGALTIAFARNPDVSRVFAVDIEAARFPALRALARVYGVAEKIETQVASIEGVLHEIEADHLVLDPPWGGRDYDRQHVSFEDFPIDLRAVAGLFRGRITLKLPRSLDVSTLPAGFSARAMVDDRGILKFLIAERAARVKLL